MRDALCSCFFLPSPARRHLQEQAACKGWAASAGAGARDKSSRETARSQRASEGLIFTDQGNTTDAIDTSPATRIIPSFPTLYPSRRIYGRRASTTARVALEQSIRTHRATPRLRDLATLRQLASQAYDRRWQIGFEHKGAQNKSRWCATFGERRRRRVIAPKPVEKPAAEKSKPAAKAAPRIRRAAVARTAEKPVPADPGAMCGS